MIPGIGANSDPHLEIDYAFPDYLQNQRLNRNLTFNHLQSGSSCIRPPEHPGDDLLLHLGEFYSLRFKVEPTEQSNIQFTSIRGLFMVTISECPGDPGKIIPNGVFRQNQTGLQRTLYYYNADIKTYNETTNTNPEANTVKNDKCIFDSWPNGTMNVSWHASDIGFNSAGCRLTPGKYYYLNLIPIRATSSSPSNCQPCALRMPVQRSCINGLCNFE